MKLVFGVRSWIAILAVLAAALAGAATSSGRAVSPVIIYDAFPSGVAGNIPSVGFEATSASEFGDEIQFASGPQRELQSATVMMSSWGCESGSWVAGDCLTTPGATFSHSLTLTFYAVAGTTTTPAAGAVLATKTQTFEIPYRPSADPACGDGRWHSSADNACYNGLATPVTFTFMGQVLPDQVIWGISYNTTHYGATPIGEGASCYTEPGGCGYDSLNVGTYSVSPIVGTDVAEDAAFANSSWTGFYCDGGAGGTGTFRFDSTPGCWVGYRPLIRVSATEPLGSPPSNKDQCKKDGWKAFNNPAFKNQGDCISFVSTGK
jgi:hypothetical protein